MWYVILFASCTALIFRVFPFAFHRSALLNSKDSKFYRVLNYSCQAMMGCIVFDSSFGQQDIVTWARDFRGFQLLELTLLILCFSGSCTPSAS